MDPVKALRDAAEQHRAAVEQERKDRARRDRTITNAIRYGVRPGVVKEITGLSHEQIRRISGVKWKRADPPTPE